MSKTEILIEEIIKQRPDYDKEKICRLIDDKKKTVGAGYLTDSGAAFLVASDLNVSLHVISTSELKLKDLYIGANEVTVVGRILNVYPTKKYRKKDGKEGQYRRLTIFDEDTFVPVTLWDEKTNQIEDIHLNSDDIIKIQKGYVKSGLDGSPVIHVGNRGILTQVNDETIVTKLPSLEDITQDISSINKPEANLVLNGIVKYDSRISEYTGRNGNLGRVLQIYLNSLKGGHDTRVAIWNNDSLSKMKIPVNSVVRLIGIKSRFSPDGSVELHGNEGTLLQIVSIPKTYGETSSNRFRVLSIGKLQVKNDKSYSASLLIVDESNTFYTLILKDNATDILSELKTDLLIDCEFREISPLTLLCNDNHSIKIINEDDNSFARLKDIFRKVKDIKESQLPIMIEVIALSRASSQDIVTRSGETVTKTEVIVGDETREIKVVAWRNLSGMLSEISPGQRLKIIGVIPTRGLGGVAELQIKSYSQVDNIS